MSKIYFLCTFIFLLFGSLQATFILNDTLYLNSSESSLDLSKEHPKLSGLLIEYDHKSDWHLLRDYYLSQTTDLGLCNNKNLRHIEIYATELFPFFLTTYLPQVISLYSYVNSSHWEALSSFPNLKKISCLDRAPFEELAIYNPHISTIEMWTSQFKYFSDEELTAIAQMKELKNLKYECNWSSINANSVIERQKEMQQLFPKIKIQLIMHEHQDEEND